METPSTTNGENPEVKPSVPPVCTYIRAPELCTTATAGAYPYQLEAVPEPGEEFYQRNQESTWP